MITNKFLQYQIHILKSKKKFSLQINLIKLVKQQDYNMRINLFVISLVLFLLQSSFRIVNCWCLRTIFAGITSIESVDFSPDNQYIITGQTSGRVLMWNTDTLQIVKTYQFPYKLWQAVYSPDQSMIVVVGQDDNIIILDGSNLTAIRTINTNQNKVYDVDFDSNSSEIVTCGDDKKAKVWNATTGNLLQNINIQNTPYACEYGGDGDWIVVAGVNFVEGYDKSGNSNNFVQSYNFNQGPRTFYGTCIRPSSNYSISVSSNGQILQSKLDTTNTDQYITGSTGTLLSCAYSPDSSYFAVAGGNRDVYLFNASGRANRLQATLFANSSTNFKTTQFSPNSNYLLAGNQEGSIYFYKRFCSGCPVGSFPDQTTCTLCAQKMVGCAICISSSSCKSCMAGYYISSSSCKSCAVLEGCANCNSSSNCTLCLPNYYQTGLTCTRCLSAQYGCVQCWGPLQCLQCDKNSYLSGGICIKCTTLTYCIYCNSSSYCLQCIAGYYQNAGVCTPCPSAVNPYCLACQTATNCSLCIDGFRVNSSYLCERCSPECLFCNTTNHCFDCVQNMYVNSNFQCQFCVHPCVTCTSQTYCMSCVESYYLSAAGVCSNCIIPCFSCNSSTRCQSCIIGYYLNTGTNLCVLCSTVGVNCRECTSSVCLACQAEFMLIGGVCKNCSQFMSNCQQCSNTTQCQQCLKGYYATNLTGNNSCSPCQSDCSSCISATNCSACIPGYYLVSNGCLPCSGNCLSCQSSSVSTCTSCRQGYYLSTATIGQCLTCVSAIGRCMACHNNSYCVGCQTGYYMSSPTTCTICTAPCVQCKTSVTDCLSCDLGYYFYTSGGLGQCGQCNYGCSQCSNSSSVCLNCISGYYYDSSGLRCLQCGLSIPGCIICNSSSSCIECSSGYFPVLGVCQLCSTNISRCLKCNVFGSICSICDYGFCLSSTNTSCLSCNTFLANCQHCITSSACQTCIQGFYVSGNNCAVCSSGCLTCYNSSICQNCRINYIMLSTKTCQLCQDAIQGCRVCSSTSVCQNCLLGYYLSGSVCTLCRIPLQGCQSCASASSCNYCSIYYQLQTNNTCIQCSNLYPYCQICGNSSIGCSQCQMGYYLNSGGSCISCNPASTQGCIKCLNNTTCLQCMAGYYYNTTDYTCLKCQSVYSNCIYCSSSACLQCQSGFYLSSGSCSRCTIQGCQICDDTNPSRCVTCNTRYYKSGTSCLLCSSSISQCQQCSISTVCTECSIGFYITSINNCNMCSNVFNGCQICSPTECISCHANFFLNQTDKRCVNCTDFIPGCAYCISQSICLSCQNGYYIINQTCQFCAVIPGCLYCINDTFCTYCQQSYFVCNNNNNTCCLCSEYIPGCYACSDNSTCISCIGNFQAIAGVCVQIRPEVLKNTKRIQLKSYFVDDLNLKHILYAQDFLFVYIEQDWSTQAEIVLIDKDYKKTQLIIYRVEWSQSMDQLIFYTDNPITKQLSQSMKNMPFTKQSTRLLSSTSVNLDFNLKMMISQKAAQDVMPSLNQVGDLYLDYPYFDASFYESYIRNQPFYYFIFGIIITLAIFVGFSLKSCFYPQLFDKGGIIPHILAIKTGALGLYPTFAQYVNYCYGFMAADIPWANKYIGTNFGRLGDYSPDPYRMYYINLSLISTYFLALILILGLWFAIALFGYLLPQHMSKVQSTKAFLYNFFVFGTVIAGSLSLQGVILNSIHSLSLNTVFYTLGIIIYIGIFVQLVYSWFISRQFVMQLLKITNQKKNNIKIARHLEKLRIFTKATLLSLMHLAPLYIISIVVFTEVAVILLEYILTRNNKINPKLQFLSHVIANLSLLLLILMPDALIGIILVSILIVFVLVIEILRFFYQIQKYSQIVVQESINEKPNQKVKFTSQESLAALKQNQQNSFKIQKDNGLPIVPLIKSRDFGKKKKKQDQNILFSINQLNFDNI